MTFETDNFTFGGMGRSPLILVTPSVEKHGVEFNDLSASLSIRYNQAVIEAGGVPVTAPTTLERAVLADAVERMDGVLLTGGDDINPAIYEDNKLPEEVAETVEVTPDGGMRDLTELILIDEIFKQRKPLLAICRGHQMLNVAFGGKLVVDISRQMPGAINHKQMDRPFDLVHEAALTRGSLVSKICKTSVLEMNSTHHQGVLETAEPFAATACSSDGIVEVMELKSECSAMLPFLLSLQFHPERLVEKHARYRAIFERFVTVCAK
jgi:putative glutamine amidotransferase